MRLLAKDSAFDAPACANEDEIVFSPSQYLAADNSNPELLLEQDDWQASREGSLREALDKLDERSQTILQSRWLADKKLTLIDLAEKFNISAERVRQLEKNALDKLKKHLVSK